MKLLIALLSALVILPPAPRAIPAPFGSPLPPGVSQSAPIPFTSNGCTGFREKTFFSCCYVHDFAYWSGGTWSDRRRADNNLRQCVRDISHNIPMAYVAYALVRMTSGTGAMFDFGWGRGWRDSERDLYAPITPTQRARIDNERRRVCKGLTLNPDSQRYYVDDMGPRDDIRQIRPEQARQLCGSELPAAAKLPAPAAAATAR